MKLSFVTTLRALTIVAAVAILFAASASAQTDSTVVDSTAVDSTAAPATIAPPVAPPSAAATTATTTQETPPVTAPKKKKEIFYGGTIGLTFGDYTRISISPMVGMKLAPRVSAGVEATYEYIEDERYNPKLTASNYGGGVFTRFFPVARAYAHAEFDYMSYEFQISGSESDRTWVPFVLLGGGVVLPISPRAAMTAEILFDVLQDDNSPYDSGEPFVSVGVGVGI